MMLRFSRCRLAVHEGSAGMLPDDGTSRDLRLRLVLER
jgi:hypothetical protein